MFSPSGSYVRPSAVRRLIGRFSITFLLVASGLVPVDRPVFAMRQTTAAADVSIRLDTDQARLTLDLLEARAKGETVDSTRWSAIFATEGFRRVLERERGIDEMLGLNRGYSEQSFHDWAVSDAALEGLDGRRRTLGAWRTIDVEKAGRRAMRYLPEGLSLSASVYPIVRKQTNSFVWDLPDNPAIFLSVDEDISAAEMEITLAHELHHVGLSGGCADQDDDEIRNAGVQAARDWLSGFGEGLAVLAAAGGPNGPIHGPDQTALQSSWAGRMDSLEVDMRRVETFLLDVADGSAVDDEAQRRGMAFINSPGVPQGPFYTLGWFMAATIEREFGRDAVVNATCDHALLISTYQRAARAVNERPEGGKLPLWSPEVLQALGIDA